MKTFTDLGGEIFFISKELPPPASGSQWNRSQNDLILIQVSMDNK